MYTVLVVSSCNKKIKNNQDGSDCFTIVEAHVVRPDGDCTLYNITVNYVRNYEKE